MKTKGLISLVATFFVSCFQQLHAQDAAGVKIIVEQKTHPLIWIILGIMFGLLVAIFFLSRPFELSKIMFHGSAEELKETKVTQPALFVHAIATLVSKGSSKPDAVAGHSLGEFSALVANETLSFEDGLKLVYARAMAMQAACDVVPGTMAAVLGLENDVVENVCDSIDDVVVAANYNCPGQLVISGSLSGVQTAMQKLTEAGAKRAILLEVGGAFHSPLMEPARIQLEEAIMQTPFKTPICPIYQNVTGAKESNPDIIKQNLIAQLTGAVRWTQTIENIAHR